MGYQIPAQKLCQAGPKLNPKQRLLYFSNLKITVKSLEIEEDDRIPDWIQLTSNELLIDITNLANEKDKTSFSNRKSYNQLNKGTHKTMKQAEAEFRKGLSCHPYKWFLAQPFSQMTSNSQWII